MFAIELCDDDGVLVLATAIALKRRFASRELDYEYPRELLSAAGDEELSSGRRTRRATSPSSSAWENSPRQTRER